MMLTPDDAAVIEELERRFEREREEAMTSWSEIEREHWLAQPWNRHLPLLLSLAREALAGRAVVEAARRLQARGIGVPAMRELYAALDAAGVK